MMIKTCTINGVLIYTSIQNIIYQFMTLNTKPWFIHTLELLLQQRNLDTTHPKKTDVTGKEVIIDPIKYSSWNTFEDSWNISS